MRYEIKNISLAFAGLFISRMIIKEYKNGKTLV